MTFFHSRLPPLITCQFRGQIGNQLFQAATAYSLAQNSGQKLIIQLQDLEKAKDGYINAQYIFSHFPFEKSKTKKVASFSSLYRHTDANPRRYQPIPSHKRIKLKGFYQSEKYFAKYRNDLLKLFFPPPQIINQIQMEYGELFKSRQVVGLHIRTFIRDTQCESAISQRWDYYLKALTLFPQDTVVLVFSDYPEYAKAHLPTTEQKFIFIEGNQDYYDFWLLYHCHHFIVAPNSTFSWWAAWLCNQPGKIVVCEGNQEQSPDFYPSNWVVP